MLYLMNEPFTLNQIGTVNELINFYSDDEQHICSDKGLNDTNDNIIYTVQDKLKSMENATVSRSYDDNIGENSYGIWREDSGNFNISIFFFSFFVNLLFFFLLL